MPTHLDIMKTHIDIKIHTYICIYLFITVHEMPCIVIPSFFIRIIILCTELLRLIQLEPLNLETFAA